MEKYLYSTECLEDTQSMKILPIVILYKLTSESPQDSDEEKGWI